MTIHNNNNETSSSFQNVKEKDLILFDKAFKQNYELIKSCPHKEFSSENHSLSACLESCEFPTHQLHCTVPPEVGAGAALQIQINIISSSSINFGSTNSSWKQ